MHETDSKQEGDRFHPEAYLCRYQKDTLEHFKNAIAQYKDSM